MLGFKEEIEIGNTTGTTKTSVEARIDTGAAYSSIDVKLASELKLGPIVKYITIRNSHGDSLRPVVEGLVKIKGEEIKVLLSISDRSSLNFPVLIGRNLISQGFYVGKK